MAQDLLDATRMEPRSPRDPMTAFATSLCHGCLFVRLVQGRLDQTYLLCRNQEVPQKYPPQPVVACPGYLPGKPGEAPAAAEP